MSTLWLAKEHGLYKLRWSLPPKNSSRRTPPPQLIYSWAVELSKIQIIEKQIHKNFENKYVSTRGPHWFDGDVEQIKKDIDAIIADADSVKSVGGAYSSDELFWGIITRKC
jgi:hypothetical protein